MWILLSLLSALTVSLSDLMAKIYMKELDPENIALVRFLSSGLFFVPLIIINIKKILHISLESIPYLAILTPLEIIAFTLYSKAINTTHISLVMPITALSPLLVAIVSMIMIEEYPSILGAIGIILVTLGGITIYGPKSSRKKENLKGIIAMVTATLIYAITTTLGKICVILVDPFSFAIIYYPIIGTSFLLLRTVTKGKSCTFRDIKALKNKYVLLSGFLLTVSIITHFLAISMTNASYMIALKRISLLFSVILGHYILKETEFKNRLFGSLLMIIGLFFISMAK
ncbi:MAG: DMT family transporter [Thermosulfidibacteraceae bacterium]